MRWAFKENDYEEVNIRYIKISELINEHIQELRERLKLPNID